MSAARAILERVIDALDNPILVKELRGAFRRRRYLYLLTSLLALVGVIVLGTVSSLSAADGDPSDAGRLSFLAFFVIELLLVVLVFPAFSCTSIVEERIGKSFDLLVTTRLQAWQIVLGKLLASTVYGFTFIIATAPLVAIAFLYGGVTPGKIVFAYLTLLLVGVVVSSYAIMISSMATSSARAVVRTFLLVPFVLAFAMTPFAILAIGVFLGPLAKARSCARLGEVIHALSPVNTALVWVGSLGWTLAAVVLFFLVASNAIKPPLADRTSSLRAWFLIVWLSLLALAAATLVANPPPSSYVCILELTRFFGLSLISMGAAAVAFGVDEGETHRLGAILRGWRRLLGPGAQRGALFVLSLAALSYAVAAVVVLLVVGGHELGPTGGWESPASIIGWGSLWSMGFLLALTQAGVLLARLARSATVVRLWLSFGVAVLLIYPMFWFYVDASQAKGDLYKGYAVSPWTVAYSIFTRPKLYERQTVLFSRSGWEVIEAKKGFARQVQGLPREERDATMAALERDLLVEVRQEGVRVHKASTALYWLLGLALLGFNLRGVAGRRGAPKPGAVDPAAGQPESTLAAPPPEPNSEQIPPGGDGDGFDSDPGSEPE